MAEALDLGRTSRSNSLIDRTREIKARIDEASARRAAVPIVSKEILVKGESYEFEAGNPVPEIGRVASERAGVTISPNLNNN